MEKRCEYLNVAVKPSSSQGKYPAFPESLLIRHVILVTLTPGEVCLPSPGKKGR